MAMEMKLNKTIAPAVFLAALGLIAGKIERKQIRLRRAIRMRRSSVPRVKLVPGRYTSSARVPAYIYRRL